MSIITMSGKTFYFYDNVLKYVSWKFIPGRGPVPIAGRGERARIRKAGKSFRTAVNEGAAKEKAKRKKKISDLKKPAKVVPKEKSFDDMPLDALKQARLDNAFVIGDAAGDKLKAKNETDRNAAEAKLVPLRQKGKDIQAAIDKKEGKGQFDNESKKKTPVKKKTEAEQKRDFERDEDVALSLRNDRITGSSEVGEVGINETMILETSSGTKGVFKPASGEIDYLEAIPKGEAYKREVASYEISREIKMGDVPVTVERTHGGKRGSMQEFVPETEPLGFLIRGQGVSKESVEDLAAFDLLIHNTDRHGGNVLISKDKRAIAIDNGFSLPEKIRQTSPNPSYEIKTVAIPSIGVSSVIPKRVKDNLSKASDTELRSIMRKNKISGNAADWLIERKQIIMKSKTWGQALISINKSKPKQPIR